MAATATSKRQVQLVGLDNTILMQTIVIRLYDIGEIPKNHYTVSYDHLQNCMESLMRRRFLHR
jgi:DNA polymerase II small subunit/DNA polymerase delta subunit B